MIENYSTDIDTIGTTEVMRVFQEAWLDVAIIGLKKTGEKPVALYSALFSRAGNLMKVFQGDVDGSVAAAFAKEIYNGWPWLLRHTPLFSAGGYWIFVEEHFLGDGKLTPVGVPATIIYTLEGRRLIIGRAFSKAEANALVKRLVAEASQAPSP
jgi:hypothetical protein